ncbi:internalin E [Pseudovibrio sp. FO-BEG1]|uniref:leucine-rich repeat domain-containing protein n=1 Tax=Pseudovibrio sp. (strain FO-BEG1) TaxID=911045 RepID=UPI000238C254|nr:leucine-rich repeat domain-containing protein [Pseudovibrio sp. FO-BEG1]AEV36024.1 internalin E [Pseudovibrio sp. FO-BEG1]
MRLLVHCILWTMLIAHQAVAQSDNCVQIGSQCQKRTDHSLIIRKAADLADLSAVADAPWIRLLSISGRESTENQIDLSVIAHLTQLERLDLTDLGAFDASGIQNESLTSLSIRNSRPLSYDFAASLEKLQTLQINNAIDSISELPLNKLGALEQLSIINSGVSSLEGIEALQNLEAIALTNNPVRDLGPLAQLKLRRVTLVSNQITDLSPLARSTEITHLRIGGPSIASLNGLRLGPSLVHFDGSKSGLRDISALAPATNVKRVLLEQANVTNVAALRGKFRLEQIDLRKNPISDLSPLVDLPNLTVLDLSDTMVFDLAPLRHLKSVKSVSLSRIPAEDISPLVGMIRVEGLWLNDTLASDLSPLLEMPSLDTFVVDDQKMLTKDNLPTYMETRLKPKKE